MKQTTELKHYAIGFDPENEHAAFAAGVLPQTSATVWNSLR